MLASFGADDSPATVEGDTGTADAALARPSFSKALRASIAGQHAVGLTASQAQALRSYIARKYKIAHSVAGALINTAFVVAKERSEEHTSELQSLMRISYAVFCLKKKK